MFLHKSDQFTFYFGDASDMIYPQAYLATPADIFFAKTESTQRIIVQLQLTHLFFAQQVHGINGIQVTPELLSGTPAFTVQADFLYTKTTAVGIGVMTADCLPIVFADPVNGAIAVIHAGWRGAIHNIAQEALQHMHTVYGTKPPNVLVFLGPSARTCCYRVGPEFVAIAAQNSHGGDVLEERAEKLFLDVPRLVHNQLIAAGVQPQSISQEYNLCTMCDTRFYSHRRDAQRSGRQMTIVTLA
jgi:polyphenol oxidase